MNSDQVKAHAAGFLHALATSPTLAAQWQATSSDDQRAALIGQHLGLAQTPSTGDLQAMAQYAGDNLSDAVAKANVAGAPTMMILATQS